MLVLRVCDAATATKAAPIDMVPVLAGAASWPSSPARDCAPGGGGEANRQADRHMQTHTDTSTRVRAHRGKQARKGTGARTRTAMNSNTSSVQKSVEAGGT